MGLVTRLFDNNDRSKEEQQIDPGEVEAIDPVN